MMNGRKDKSDGDYHYNSEREGVPLEGEADHEESMRKEPIVKEDMEFDKMHPDFPKTHGYLKKSLSDIKFMGDSIKSMKKERAERFESDEEPVDMRRRRGVSREVKIDEFKKSSEFRRKKIRNKARILVKRNLLQKGYSKEFIREHSDLIRKKVDEYLSD